MPDAITLSSDDFSSVSRPAKPKRARRAKDDKPAKGGKFPRLRLRLSPRVALFLGFIGLVGVGVPLNALYFQDGRHPAPLFKSGLPAPLPPARPAALNTPAPAPAAAPVQHAAAPARATSVKAEAARAEAAKAETDKGGRDEIGMLLDGGAPAKAKPAAEAPDKHVLFAQKALAKLGYPLRADGVFGGTTRQAIEKFERANNLPVKGELTPKILKQLAARASMPKE